MQMKFTEEQLNNIDKSLLVQMFLNMQDQLEMLTKETHALNEKMQLMMEQLVLSKNNRFGRFSEKMQDTYQISFMEVDGMIVFFNEAEAECNLDMEEPDDLEVKPTRKQKTKGKREEDIKGLDTIRVDHYMTDDELISEFGENGWKQMPDAISKKYHFVPAKVEIEEHHVGVYASKNDERIVKAKHPKSLLHGSLVSASIAAAIINGKYVNIC